MIRVEFICKNNKYINMHMCAGLSGSNVDQYSVFLTRCQTAQMFALLFKCLDLLLLLLHGEEERQGHNHSNEGSHIYLFIYLFSVHLFVYLG